jgi:hypothetical protein
MIADRITEATAVVAVTIVLLFTGCGTATGPVEKQLEVKAEAPSASLTTSEPSPSPSPDFPNLQTEITDKRFVSTTSPIAAVDFRNHAYPLPRGWQNPDGSDAQLVDGRLDPVAVHLPEDISDEEKVKLKSERRIGLSYVTTRFLDVNFDGQDEAAVILKIETTGNAIPQIVYVYEFKDGGPEMMWYFRTGDRADGGLKDIRTQDRELVIELYGQDRFVLGEVETGKITGDEEQLCCPTHFTRSFYKWNGKHFLMQRKRLTFSISEPSNTPVENLGDIVNQKVPNKKSR